MLEQLTREPLLTRDEEQDLAGRAEAGDAEARERLVTANLRLVIWVARRYEGSGVPLADLVQEGVFGLMRAVDGYDWRLGHRFSTYATHWIRQRIRRAVASQSRLIRFPGPVAERAWRIDRVEAELTLRDARSPSEEELAEAAGVTAAELSQVRRAGRAVASLDAALDGGAELGDLVAVSSDDVEAEVWAGDRARAVRKLVATLPARQREVVELRYGLGGRDPMSLSQAGEALGVSRERVRQIESRALARLSTFAASAALRPTG